MGLKAVVCEVPCREKPPELLLTFAFCLILGKHLFFFSLFAALFAVAKIWKEPNNLSVCKQANG